MSGRPQSKFNLCAVAAPGQSRSRAVRFAEADADAIAMAIAICEQIDGVAFVVATALALHETANLADKKKPNIVAEQADEPDMPTITRSYPSWYRLVNACLQPSRRRRHRVRTTKTSGNTTKEYDDA